MLELIEKAPRDGSANDVVTLTYELRQKGRQRVRLDSGREAVLVLPHGTQIDDGDRLRAADGTIVRVLAALEQVTVARTDETLRLSRACYHLGNRHVPLQIGPGWVRYQPDHVLDEMVSGLGLVVTHEPARFQPERGAYHSHSNGSAHSHGHGSSHGHRH